MGRTARAPHTRRTATSRTFNCLFSRIFVALYRPAMGNLHCCAIQACPSISIRRRQRGDSPKPVAQYGKPAGEQTVLFSSLPKDTQLGRLFDVPFQGFIVIVGPSGVLSSVTVSSGYEPALGQKSKCLESLGKGYRVAIPEIFPGHIASIVTRLISTVRQEGIENGCLCEINSRMFLLAAFPVVHQAVDGKHTSTYFVKTPHDNIMTQRALFRPSTFHGLVGASEDDRRNRRRQRRSAGSTSSGDSDQSYGKNSGHSKSGKNPMPSSMMGTFQQQMTELRAATAQVLDAAAEATAAATAAGVASGAASEAASDAAAAAAAAPVVAAAAAAPVAAAAVPTVLNADGNLTPSDLNELRELAASVAKSATAAAASAASASQSELNAVQSERNADSIERRTRTRGNSYPVQLEASSRPAAQGSESTQDLRSGARNMSVV